jgi:hypothetical protein
LLLLLGYWCFQVIGGGLRESFLVDGVAFKKTFSYAGFEQQPKSFKSKLLSAWVKHVIEKGTVHLSVSHEPCSPAMIMYTDDVASQ